MYRLLTCTYSADSSNSATNSADSADSASRFIYYIRKLFFGN